MIKLTTKIWGHIRRINQVWNDKIQYETDSMQYGRSEYWAFPDEIKASLRGDCEDFAIIKRYALESFDIPGYYATCWTREEFKTWHGYHAVLIVSTDRGDFVLSNGLDDVPGYAQLPWLWDKMECEDGQWRKIL